MSGDNACAEHSTRLLWFFFEDIGSHIVVFMIRISFRYDRDDIYQNEKEICCMVLQTYQIDISSTVLRFLKWIVFSESKFSIMYIIYIENNKERKNIKSWIKHYGTLIDNRTKVYLNNISIIRLCKIFRFHILSSSADIQNLSIRKWAHCCFRLLVSIQAVC